ncbi:isopentenyl-diphosphate Delta-isomerase [Aestuariicoccus sp. MJ-SS9]|uniref:isopentenyl-diphosphate Delta-isomerase n=1 Tax=Aestuariicoccus sp. MJ-SS9 TaxID=3079855 RepID=UPI0029069E03|nr:isopentenyl-diphosphate Delta-isomerase [Aestuariicoccus sp. MJ-SS9]MDU8910947.1 isopentenyl-diphosphate Delta-isomerase [Aestuariicoccus sp. MJ-SS9]
MTILIPAWIDGTLTPVEKLEAHQRGLKHKAVSVFVTRGDKVLIQQRALGKYHTPGLWANTCCTHPEWDESSLDCANRRLDEELGIAGLSPDYRDRVEYRADVGGGLIEHEVVDIFVAEAAKNLQIAPDPDEVMATEWIAYPALLQRVKDSPSDFTPWLRIYLDTYAQRIFGDTLLARA